VKLVLLFVKVDQKESLALGLTVEKSNDFFSDRFVPFSRDKRVRFAIIDFPFSDIDSQLGIMNYFLIGSLKFPLCS
jgi:hypothetical protein